jgi:hypothetical protein
MAVPLALVALVMKGRVAIVTPEFAIAGIKFSYA